ncbi:MAG: protein translocase subunit SecF [Pseudohongiellaceae bacterium]
MTTLTLLQNEIDFMGKRVIAGFISTALVVISIGSLAFNSLQFGLDFTSGTSIRLEYADPVSIPEVNETLNASGFPDAVVVSFGTERDIRIILPVNEEVPEAEQATRAATLGDEIAALLEATSGSDITVLGSDYVSAKVGAELAEQGGLGLLVALGIVLIYIAVRFQYKFALGAVAALGHDVIITLGIFSVFRMEFDLTVLAALLAIIGYSLNDTIVVFDRIRENFRRMRRGTPTQMMNASLNQTLSRTVITSFTTLLVLMAMLVFGGDAVSGFAIALTIGVVVGTYSSIYVAANVALSLNVTKEDLALPVKPDPEVENSLP